MTAKKKRTVPQWLHPYELSLHAIQRWHERHRPAWSRSIATANLRHLLPQAVLVEGDASNMQAIWALPDEAGHPPLLVVDWRGMVRTVLPRGALKPTRPPR